MEMVQVRRRVVLSTGVAFAFAVLTAGCGSGSAGSAPAPISPEAEKATQDMLKNKSQSYAERYKNKGRRP